MASAPTRIGSTCATAVVLLVPLAIASGPAGAEPLAPAPTSFAAAAAPSESARMAPAATNLENQVARSLSAAASSSSYLGKYLSAVVIDDETGGTVWSHRSGTRRAPASTLKVLTAHTVLRSLRSTTTFTTKVHQSADGSIYLRGGGDPSLGTARLSTLAGETASLLLSQGRTEVNLYVDATYFPSPSAPYGWKSRDIYSEAQYVRGLALVGYRGSDGSLAAGRVFAALLKKQGVTATLKGHSTTPISPLVAQTRSAPVSALVQRMLLVSNNDYAEFLLRQAAKAKRASTTTKGAAAFQLASLAKAGIPTKGLLSYDGSGLSRANRMPTATLAAGIASLYRTPATKQIAFAWAGMPRAGQTGTLAKRFRTTATRCATGKVIAKTGSLNAVNALAGVALGADGRKRIFVLLDSGPSNSTAVRKALDVLATGVVGCRLA